MIYFSRNTEAQSVQIRDHKRAAFCKCRPHWNFDIVIPQRCRSSIARSSTLLSFKSHNNDSKWTNLLLVKAEGSQASLCHMCHINTSCCCCCRRNTREVFRLVQGHIYTTLFWCAMHCFHSCPTLLSSVPLSSDPLGNNLAFGGLSWQWTKAPRRSHTLIYVARIMSLSSLCFFSPVFCMLLCSKGNIFFCRWINPLTQLCMNSIRTWCVCDRERKRVRENECKWYWGGALIQSPKQSIPSCDLINNCTRDRDHDLYSAAQQLQTDTHGVYFHTHTRTHPTAVDSLMTLALLLTGDSC